MKELNVNNLPAIDSDCHWELRRDVGVTDDTFRNYRIVLVGSDFEVSEVLKRRDYTMTSIIAAIPNTALRVKSQYLAQKQENALKEFFDNDMAFKLVNERPVYEGS